MKPSDLEATVRTLADKEAIRDLARRYAHYVWRKDVDGIVELFTEDGRLIDTGVPPSETRARPRCARRIQSMIGGPDFHAFVHNHLVELDGDTATGVCYLELRVTVETAEV